MTHRFDVTLDFFAVEDGRVVVASGNRHLGPMGDDGLLAILNAFRSADMALPFEDEPAVVIRTRHGHFCVRNEVHRLLLYDLHDVTEPAQVLSPEELLAEVNESATEARDALLHSSNGDLLVSSARLGGTRAPFIPVPQPPRRGFPWLLSSLCIVLAAAYGVSVLNYREPAAEGPETMMTGHELVVFRNSLSGTYSTGTGPGHHGLVIKSDGSIRLIQINREQPASMLFDEYAVGRYQGKACLVVHQVEPLILVLDTDKLSYCGEIYRKSF